jgi:hypothetical protein
LKYKFAKPLKDATNALFGVAPAVDWEAVKDRPALVFHGMSPRQAFIKVSEEMVKPALGKQHFGKVLTGLIAEREGNMPAHVNLIAIISDGGFVEEMEPVIARFGAENIVLIRIEREGCNFSNDSRKFVTIKGVKTWVIDNNRSIEEATNDAYTLISADIIRGARKNA